MGFEGLSDVEKMSEKEKKKILNPKHVKRMAYIFLIAFIYSVAMSIFFYSIKYILKDINPEYIQDFTRLGSDCLVMGLGFLCLLKLLYDKESYVKSINNKVEN